MPDSDAPERRAEELLHQSLENIDTFSKSMELLKSLAEHRKILAETDKISTESKNEKRSWTKIAALAPAVAALITGLTFGITFLYQRKQAEIAAQQSEESQWRNALQKVNAGDSSEAAASALTMMSFFGSPYARQSRQIAAALCPNIPDKRVFDVVVGQLYETTDNSNEDDLVDVGRSLSMQIRSVYNSLPAADRARETFADFLQGSTSSDDSNGYAEYRSQADVDRYRWELDTVADVLYKLWTGTKHLDASSLDFSGIVFWNDEFRAFDKVPNFQKATMDKFTGFYGKCSVPPAITSNATGSGPDIHCGAQ